MAKCKKCGTELRDYYEYCLNCGAYNHLSERENYKKCQYCGMKNPENSVYCEQCQNLFVNTKTTSSVTKRKQKVKSSNNKGLITIIILSILVIITIIDYRWFIGILILGFLVLLGWGMDESQKPRKTPSEKQKRHKTKNWAKRNMRQNLKRKL